MVRETVLHLDVQRPIPFCIRPAETVLQQDTAAVPAPGALSVPDPDL